jgi:hypothetical protein
VGVLELRLEKSSYRWAFLPVEGEMFTDRGTRSCHGKP